MLVGDKTAFLIKKKNHRVCIMVKCNDNTAKKNDIKKSIYCIASLTPATVLSKVLAFDLKKSFLTWTHYNIPGNCVGNFREFAKKAVFRVIAETGFSKNEPGVIHFFDLRTAWTEKKTISLVFRWACVGNERLAGLLDKCPSKKFI